ncbi:unnamed protein product [Amoebophrya sp. A25]|nr:unnamed protein product [Amoebophrya sp. A25]|eukprot:GSA25T00020481001.1
MGRGRAYRRRSCAARAAAMANAAAGVSALKMTRRGQMACVGACLGGDPPLSSTTAQSATEMTAEVGSATAVPATAVATPLQDASALDEARGELDRELDLVDQLLGDLEGGAALSTEGNHRMDKVKTALSTLVSEDALANLASSLKAEVETDLNPYNKLYSDLEQKPTRDLQSVKAMTEIVKTARATVEGNIDAFIEKLEGSSQSPEQHDNVRSVMDKALNEASETMIDAWPKLDKLVGSADTGEKAGALQRLVDEEWQLFSRQVDKEWESLSGKGQRPPVDIKVRLLLLYRLVSFTKYYKSEFDSTEKIAEKLRKISGEPAKVTDALRKLLWREGQLPQ